MNTYRLKDTLVVLVGDAIPQREIESIVLALAYANVLQNL